MLKRNKGSLYTVRGLTYAVMLFAVIALLCSLIWFLSAAGILPQTLFGTSSAYVLIALIIPLVLGFVLYRYSKVASDIEQHLRKYENE